MATPANISTLNQFAKGLFQETASPLADFLAPVVPTGAASFSVIDYAKRSALQVPSAKRAIGGDSTAVMTDGERININPNAQCRVATTIQDTKLNSATGKSRTLATEVWVYFAEESANQFDASAFKTFRVSINPFGVVRASQKDFGEKIITEWTEAAYVNNADAAARLTVTAG